MPTNDATTPSEIEFLDLVDALDVEAADGEAADEASEAIGGDGRGWLGLGVAMLIATWLVMSAGAEPPEALDSDPPVVEHTAPAPPETTAATSPIAPPVFGLWPTPPTDRDPPVIATPAPARLPPSLSAVSLRETTLVYVNAAGVPTVVSFETGEIALVEVAAIRVHETFGVADGTVVPLTEGTGEVTPIIFHTYRDVDRPGVGTMGDEQGVGRGPELCLSGATCARPGLGVDRRQEGGFLAERLDARRHNELARLLTEWQRSGLSLESPDGYRIPVPVGVVWVIRPPSGGTASSSGVL